MVTIPEIECALTAHEPRRVLPRDKEQAAVALILRPGARDVELLFIERKSHLHDPWSGHIAFPGGRRERGDSGLRHTAMRETEEEVGLYLRSGRYLGQLSDVSGASLSVCVAGYVFAAPPRTRVTANPEEVADAFWVALSDLKASRRQQIRAFPFRGLEGRSFPAVDLLGPGRPVLWGITYRFVAQLLHLIGHDLPGSGGQL